MQGRGHPFDVRRRRARSPCWLTTAPSYFHTVEAMNTVVNRLSQPLSNDEISVLSTTVRPREITRFVGLLGLVATLAVIAAWLASVLG